jgi:uncharacterized protein (DUF2461 family)
MESAKGFPGFRKESFDFFRDLAENNNKAWFDRNRERYEEHVTGVFRSLLADLKPFLVKLNPQFEVSGKTNGNFSRINRDIRFSKDKSPYKSNYYLYVFDRRRERPMDGRLYVGLTADCITAGFATYAAWKKGRHSQLETVFRKRAGTHPQILEGLNERIVRGGRYETYWHRMEKGEWAQHAGLPRRGEDWKTLHGWVVRKVILPNARGVRTPAFAERVREIFREVYPLYAFTSIEGRGSKNRLRPWLR